MTLHHLHIRDFSSYYINITAVLRDVPSVFLTDLLCAALVMRKAICVLADNVCCIADQLRILIFLDRQIAVCLLQKLLKCIRNPQ